MDAAEIQFKVINGYDAAGVLQLVELRPIVCASPRGASVQLWSRRDQLDELLEPPAGWHWHDLSGSLRWLQLRFSPGAEELLDAALCLLNQGKDLDAPGLWNEEDLARELRARTSERYVARYVELSIEYLRFAMGCLI